MSLTPGMTMDILAAVVLLFSMFQGARNGFAKTLVSFVQWFGCILAGFFLCASVKEYIIQHTTLDEAINSYILDHISTTIEESAPYQSIPDLFSEWLSKNSDGFVYGTSYDYCVSRNYLRHQNPLQHFRADFLQRESRRAHWIS